MSLSHEDVVRIIQLLDASHFDELNLEAEGVKLNLRRNGSGNSSAPTRTGAQPVAVTKATPTAQTTTPPTPLRDTAIHVGLIEVKAPMLGTFYGAPKPGSDPFVSPGTTVTKDTVIGIIEVMKLMNSVSAGVEGTVVETLVSDGDLVEFDQVLMRVRPA
ncbi:MAG: acetyl-CoA carboxylase biotin carboxyl carrier protein [Rhodoferax sp.]|nr:acetyl-CoA carboxylase biotin carboxyl carrier protein [Rhodoferax sp.]